MNSSVEFDIPLSIKNNLFASCFSKTSNSEAYWSVYTPNSDGVRIEFSTETFMDNFDLVCEDCSYDAIKHKKGIYKIREGFHKVNQNFISLNTSGITSSILLSNTSTGGSGLYLPILINGIKYKIALSNN